MLFFLAVATIILAVVIDKAGGMRLFLMRLLSGSWLRNGNGNATLLSVHSDADLRKTLVSLDRYRYRYLTAPRPPSSGPAVEAGRAAPYGSAHYTNAAAAAAARFTGLEELMAPSVAGSTTTSQAARMTDFAPVEGLVVGPDPTRAAPAPLPSLAKATGAAQGLPQCKFFLSAHCHLQRDYVIIIDRSGSMGSGGRWAAAREAVTAVAPYICQFDPDGVDITFFDHEIEHVSNIRTAPEIQSLFGTYRPRGSTDLALALHHAFYKHFEKDPMVTTDGCHALRGTTILVITDGAPDSRSNVERVIRRAANSIETDEELSISFIQIGEDPSATDFLSYLDDHLAPAASAQADAIAAQSQGQTAKSKGSTNHHKNTTAASNKRKGCRGGSAADDEEPCKFDIVDTISAADLKTMSFGELVARSLYD